MSKAYRSRKFAVRMHPVVAQTVRRALGGLLVMAASFSLGCASTQAAPAEPVVFTAAPPPLPLPEIESGPPSPDMAWVPGYWHWNGLRYVWVPGHWESPRPDHVWQPPTYSFTGDRWMYRPGRWAKSKP